MSRTLILVPARFGSTRFPGKPLAKINGHSMISYVVRNCRESGLDFAIVTDNDEIEIEVKKLDAQVVRVNDDVSTGSERIALAYERHFSGYERIINVQGDEPLLNAEVIQTLQSFHSENSQFDITTLVRERRTDEADYNNPNVVKCILAQDSKCLYFTRSPGPYNNTDEIQTWLQHIGIYSYQVDALKKFVQLVPSRLERMEKLEQLRALENKMQIGATICNTRLIGVDAPEDIAKIEGVLRGQED